MEIFPPLSKRGNITPHSLSGLHMMISFQKDSIERDGVEQFGSGET